jgi:hypothetical protein
LVVYFTDYDERHAARARCAAEDDPKAKSLNLKQILIRASFCRLAMEKAPIRTNYIEHDCGCRRWYESVAGGPVEELIEVVEYCPMHEIESDSS